jgi:hypothetical protein
MLQLEHSIVYRCGLSVKKPIRETTSISAEVDLRSRALMFSFIIDSKGGGSTYVSLNVGFYDLPAISHAVAGKFPERAEILLEFSMLVNEHIIKVAEKTRKARADKKELAKKIITDMKAIEHFFQDRYFAATEAEKENVDQIWEQVQKVIQSLHEFE